MTESAAGLPAVAAALGADPDALGALGDRLGEALAAGIQGVLATEVTVACDALALTEANAIAEQVASDHIAFALRYTPAGAPPVPLVAIMPTADLGTLFMIDTTPEQLAHAEFAARQVDLVATGVHELLDIGATLLFTDALAGADMTLEEARLQGGAGALALLGGQPVLHLELSLGLSSGAGVRITVTLPAMLAAAIAGAPATTVKEPTARTEDPAGSDHEAENFDAEDFDAVEDAPARISQFRGPAHDAEVHPVRFPPLDAGPPAGAPQSLDLIMDVMLRVTVELGRSRMTVEDVLNLGTGAVVELDKLAGEPVDILANDRPIARGEVVVVDENFGVRVTEILSPRSRVQALAR